MSITRITISVNERTARRIKRAAGKVPVSTWVTDRLEEHLRQEELDALFEQFYLEVNPSPDSIREADLAFERLTGRRPRRGAA